MAFIFCVKEWRQFTLKLFRRKVDDEFLRDHVTRGSEGDVYFNQLTSSWMWFFIFFLQCMKQTLEVDESSKLTADVASNTVSSSAADSVSTLTERHDVSWTGWAAVAERVAGESNRTYSLNIWVSCGTACYTHVVTSSSTSTNGAFTTIVGSRADSLWTGSVWTGPQSSQSSTCHWNLFCFPHIKTVLHLTTHFQCCHSRAPSYSSDYWSDIDLFRCIWLQIAVQTGSNLKGLVDTWQWNYRIGGYSGEKWEQETCNSSRWYT